MVKSVPSSLGPEPRFTMLRYVSLLASDAGLPAISEIDETGQPGFCGWDGDAAAGAAAGAGTASAAGRCGCCANAGNAIAMMQSALIAKSSCLRSYRESLVADRAILKPARSQVVERRGVPRRWLRCR